MSKLSLILNPNIILFFFLFQNRLDFILKSNEKKQKIDFEAFL